MIVSTSTYGGEAIGRGHDLAAVSPGKAADHPGEDCIEFLEAIEAREGVRVVVGWNSLSDHAGGSPHFNNNPHGRFPALRSWQFEDRREGNAACAENVSIRSVKS